MLHAFLCIDVLLACALWSRDLNFFILTFTGDICAYINTAW